MNDPRHPHLAAGYFTQSEPADMAARPSTITPDNAAMTASTGTSAEVTLTTEPPAGEKPDSAMLSGQSFEEMSVGELRKRAQARGVQWRGVRKAALIRALRD